MLTDTESSAVLAVHCRIEREHNTKADPRVIRRNADDLWAVAADNGFQDCHIEPEIAAHNFESLVCYCGSTVEAGSGASAQTQFLHLGVPCERSYIAVDIGIIDSAVIGRTVRNIRNF